MSVVAGSGGRSKTVQAEPRGGLRGGGVRGSGADEGQELSRERIVAAAIAIADREGLAAVSIRRIAADLQSSPMALYYYVPTKRDLLSQMLDAVHGAVALKPDACQTWREALRHVAVETRRSLVLHPWLPAVRAEEPEHGREFIRVLEALLATFNRFSIEASLGVRALGALFAVANAFGTRAAGPALPDLEQEILASGEFPRVTALVTRGTQLGPEERFQEAVGWILDGVEKELRGSAKSARKQAGKREVGQV